MNSRLSKLLTGVLAAAVVAFGPTAAAAQNTGQLTGQVVATDGRLLADVQISIQGTALGTLTNEEGRYVLLNVPAGVHQVNAQIIGFATQNQTNVRVAAGETTTVDFSMPTQVLAIEELVVTGTVDPTEGVKLPFTVGRISSENMAIPTTNSALASLSGKVAGVNVVAGSGQPGTGVSILLRTPTSATRSNSPMYIVDGVVLSGIGTTSSDLESMDIESVEVVKGAAAASLYGSRAAAGVIQITTKRGAGLGIDQTQLKVRTEYGQSQVPRLFPLAERHHYLQNADGTWVDADSGLPTTARDNRALDPDGFMDNEYQTPVYNNIDGIVNPGGFLINTVSVAKNSLSTNFLASVTNYDEEGSLKEHDGFQRRSFRLNVDHRIGNDFSVSMSAFHSRSERDDLEGNPWRQVMMEFEPDVELGRKRCVDPLHDGLWYCQVPDSSVTLSDPVYLQAATDDSDARARTLLSGDIRWRPLQGLSLNANLSYDRGDITRELYASKELPPPPWSDTPTLGSYSISNEQANALNGYLSATYTRAFGALTTRTTVRGLFEREEELNTSAAASDLAVVGVQDLDVGINQSVGSSFVEERANAYLAQVGLDWDGKYILDVLGRRDESSLFGPDARENDYYRVAASYRMGEESWWPFESITEFKLRAAQGTAGGRPNFSDQYETWSVSVGGDGSTTVGKGSLGNRNLRPEHTTEQDIGVDMIFNNRYSLQLSYINTETRDLILAVPLPAVTGYSTQVVNTGTMEGKTYEATLEAQLVTRPDFSWSTTLVADRSRSTIIDWNRSCYSSALRYYCDDSGMGEMWAFQHVQSLDDLPASLSARADEFQVNDDGYVVWVGQGNSWRDGVSKDLWGTQTIDEQTGRAYSFGIPFLKTDSMDIVTYEKVGRSEPDMGWGWLNNVRYKGFNLHTHLQGQVGGNVYNENRQRTYFELRGAEQDQFGKSEETKKPFDYYTTLYNGYDYTQEFIEPGWFVKLRTVSLTYTMGSSLLESLRLGALSQVDLGFIVRNAYTWTDFGGWDPEAGSVLSRIEGEGTYPKMRQLTAYMEITF
ncbi:SusC/RagA family TonB-linked outer membrane protein [Gaopeijia maritima]|uniref:SusC/RagA family TonB-linked outer membrane protein n=1 Tax=Gaopeijia maritima TaxID=3119007 RepID=A0ABU9EAC8_9BACT